MNHQFILKLIVNILVIYVVEGFIG